MITYYKHKDNAGKLKSRLSFKRQKKCAYQRFVANYCKCAYLSELKKHTECLQPKNSDSREDRNHTGIPNFFILI